MIEDELKEAPERSNRQVAKDLGVDDKTVGAARKDLLSTAEILQLDRTIGKDGKARTTAPKRAPKAAPPALAEPELQSQIDAAPVTGPGPASARGRIIALVIWRSPIASA